MSFEVKDMILSCFPRRLSRQVRELYFSSLILVFAESLIAIFEPVFLFLFFSGRGASLPIALMQVIIFYLAIYVLYFFTIPLGAKFAKHFGYEYSMSLSSVFVVLIYLGFILMKTWFWPAIILSIVSYTLAKLFYWPAYHANFARFSDCSERGREISNLGVLQSIGGIIAPVIGGFILKFYSFPVLFVLAAVLILLSNIPMLRTKEKFEPTKFSYFGAYKFLFSKAKRRKFFSLWGYGEEFIAIVIWPIFIYVVVKDFLDLGALTAVSLFATTLIFLFIGRLTDSQDGRSILRLGTWFYFFSWLVRLFTRTVPGIFTVDVYSRLGKQALSVPITAMTYSKAMEKDSSTMGTILFFEMSLVAGKIIAMIACLLLLQFFAFSWNPLFVLAGLMSLLYLLF
ncbi:MAG: MFS transporter [bacterium]